MASPLAIIPILLHAFPADVVDADRWLASDSVIVGVNADGSLINVGLDLGLIWDPDGSAGPIPAGGDLLTPGNPAEAWSLSFVAGGTPTVLVNGAAFYGSDVILTWDGPWESASVTWLHGVGETPQVSVEQWIETSLAQDVVWFTFAVTAKSALDDVRMGKVLDPDPDAWSTGSYNTTNQAGPGWAAASGSFDDRALALAVTGGAGGICSWCTAPADIEAGSQGPSVQDAQIGVAVRLGAVAQGETVTVSFAYALALGLDGARDRAIAAAASDDHDGDGSPAAGGDCDDRDPAVSGGATEEWDGIDNDCDGAIDEDTPGSDDDGDGVTEADGDCDDADGRVHPGAAPVDGVVDANCDGVDDGTTPGADAGPAADSDGGGCAAGHGRSSVWITLLVALLAAALPRRRGGQP